jgi:hypothetical protein
VLFFRYPTVPPICRDLQLSIHAGIRFAEQLVDGFIRPGAVQRQQDFGEFVTADGPGPSIGEGKSSPESHGFLHVFTIT